MVTDRRCSHPPISSTEVCTPGHCHWGDDAATTGCIHSAGQYNRLGFISTWAENTRWQCELSVLGVLQTRTDAEAAWDEDPGHY